MRATANADLVGAIEAIYGVDQNVSRWLRSILEGLRPWLDDGLGLFGFTYTIGDALRLEVDNLVTIGCSDEVKAALAIAAAHNPDLVQNGYLVADAAATSTIAGWDGSVQAEAAHRLGVFDNWGINGRNWDRHGVILSSNRRKAQAMPRATTQVLARIAAHLASGRRLQRRLQTAAGKSDVEAIVTPKGRVEHALGAARQPEALTALAEATVARELARGKLRRDEPTRALGIWKGRVAARWSLVDVFESDGKRYVLARENTPTVPSSAVLTAREQQVLASAALGRSNKEIAYDLGLAHSTVRVLMARAGKKLGAQERQEIVRRFEGDALGTSTRVGRTNDG